MSIIEYVVLNVIVVLFPILVYFVYVCYLKINGSKNERAIFEILMLTSLYFSLKYGFIITDNSYFLFSNIPILVSYLKKNNFLAVFLSLFTICYYYFNTNINLYFVIIKYVSYFIIFYICKKRHIDNKKFIIITASFQGFFLAFVNYLTFGKENFLETLWLIILFLVVSIFILYLFDILNSLSNIFISIKELEKDRQIKNSLFKLTHEIKNPLAVCKGYLSMIDLNNIEKSSKYIKIINDEIERSLLIMADFSCLNKININKDIVDINLLVEEVCDSLKILTKSKGIKLIFNYEEEVYMNIDFNKIKQVLINIIKNSIEAIENNGNIIVNTKKNKKFFFIEVIDNGIGMNEEVLGRLKDMFFTTKKNGTGLGVALSNEIIKAHDGLLDYKSKEGVGTKVIIKLPI